MKNEINLKLTQVPEVTVIYKVSVTSGRINDLRKPYLNQKSKITNLNFASQDSRKSRIHRMLTPLFCLRRRFTLRSYESAPHF